MDAWLREFHVSRVVSGVTAFRRGGAAYRVAAPGREARHLADVAYREALAEAELRGLFRASEAALVLAERGLWSADDDRSAADLARAVEDGKAALFENFHRRGAADDLRRVLANARGKLAALDEARHSLDHQTCEAVAAASRARFLTGASLLRPDGRPYWPDPWAGFSAPDGLVDEAMACVARARLDEAGARDLARNDPWRSLWSAREHAGRGLFDAAAVDLTDEQRGLALWGAFYESVRSHPDRPDDPVVDDDDALDGWAVVSRRKAERGRAKAGDDRLGGDRVRNNEEVYVVLQPGEGPGLVDRYNTPAAGLIKAQRMEYLARHGETSEMHFPDRVMGVRAEIARLESRKRGG